MKVKTSFATKYKDVVVNKLNFKIFQFLKLIVYSFYQLTETIH